MPLWLALSVVVGIFLGTFFANRFSGNRLSIINSGSNKLNDLLHIVDDQYVDTVNVNDLVEKAMPTILSELDPHSVYISLKDVQQANDDLKGSFFGVGIEFTIRKDTLHVQNVISNGPSERAGLLAGDKIVEIDGEPFVGKGITNEEAMHRLKGDKDTKVVVGIMRGKEKKLRHYTVIRGEIPMKSVTATYMLDDNSGYIKIKNFGDKTYEELLIALARLGQEGFENLVIDLRGNTGGVDGSLSIQRADARHVRSIAVMAAAPISRFRLSFLSTRDLPRPARFSPVPFRTTTVVPSSVAVRSERVLYSSPSRCTTARWYA